MRSNFSAVQIDFSLHAHVSFYPTPCFVTLHLLLIFLLLILSFIDLTNSCCPDPEELDSVALQMSTDEACSTSTFFSCHVKNAMENITRSPLSVFGVCHMDDWLARPTCGRVLMRGKVHHLSLYIPPISRQ